MATPNPVLPEPDERVRNRAYGAIPRARKAQWEARLNGNTEGEQAATRVLDRFLDDLLSIRKPHGLR